MRFILTLFIGFLFNAGKYRSIMLTYIKNYNILENIRILIIKILKKI